jgi:hypothetical protein
MIGAAEAIFSHSSACSLSEPAPSVLRKRRRNRIRKRPMHWRSWSKPRLPRKTSLLWRSPSAIESRIFDIAAKRVHSVGARLGRTEGERYISSYLT